MVDRCPPWYSNVEIKKRYESDDVELIWDIPEYTGNEDDDERKLLRPDGKIVLKKQKMIFVLEQSVPWITNREIKITEKVEKYRNIIRNIKIENPGHEVRQVTFVIDCLGGYSKSLPENLIELSFTINELNTILIGLQKIVLSEARMLINHLKLMTSFYAFSFFFFQIMLFLIVSTCLQSNALIFFIALG